VCEYLWECRDHEYYSDDEGDDISRWELLGHVKSPACGFQTVPAVVKDLISTPFQEDVLYVTQRCIHHSHHASAWCACRGLISNFEESALAERSGACSYLRAGPEEKQKVQQEAKHRCMYCKAPLFELDKQFFRTNSELDWGDSDFEEEESMLRYSVDGFVCVHGHLILQVLHENPYETTACLEGRAMQGSGDGLEVDNSDLVQVLCERFATVTRKDGPELRVRESLDVLSASGKLRCLAERLEEGMLDRAEDGCKESDALGRHDISSSSILDPESLSGSDSPLSEILGECEYYAFWDVFESDVEAVKGLFEEVHGSERVFREYLGFRSESLSRTVQKIQRLHVLQGRRKAKIEMALEQARIPKWPDYEAVDMFVKVGRLSILLNSIHQCHSALKCYEGFGTQAL
jgi:hypothetical protein